jgi:preprotein translocase SecE subunit
MVIELYKPGQGYWVRVMTACLIGLFALATAGWLWKEGELIADRLLPKTTWQLSVSSLTGSPVQGDSLDLLGPAVKGSTLEIIGSAKVDSYRAEQRVLEIRSIAMLPGRDIREAKQAVTKGVAPGTAQLTDNMQAVALIEASYVQGGLVAIVLLAGAMLAYYLAGMRPRTVDFLIATDYEMKKVNWSTPREIMGSTWVVIGACLVISISLYIFDFAFKELFQLLGVLVR